MSKIGYSGYRFPPEIIQSVHLEHPPRRDWLAERGILVSYETVRRWVNHFGPKIAADLRKRRSKPHTIWHFRYAAERYGSRSVYCGGGEGSALTKWTSRTNPRFQCSVIWGMPVRYGLSGSPVRLSNTRSQIPSLAHRVKVLVGDRSTERSTHSMAFTKFGTLL